MPAKGTVRFIVNKAILKRAEALSSRGLDHQDIAVSLGIAVPTLYEHKAKNAEFAEAIKRGKSKGKAVLLNNMFKRAETDQRAAEFLLSRVHGLKETVVTEGTSTNLNIGASAQDVREMSEDDLLKFIQAKGGKPLV